MRLVHPFAEVLDALVQRSQQLVEILLILRREFLAFLVQNAIGQILEFRGQFLLDTRKLFLLLRQSLLLALRTLSRRR